MRMYDELADWWPLLSAPDEYDEEASLYVEAIERLATRDVRDVLELGSGGGNNASHLKLRYRMTLADLSERMLAVSRALNPECEHVAGDMRSLRLGRTFDAVLIHDAIMYMTTEEDLAAAIRTAAAHLREGGVALFVPDDTVETYRPETRSGGRDGADRSLRYLEWSHDRPPGSNVARVSYAIMVRHGDEPVRVVLDEHDFGLFEREAWLRLIARAGLAPHAIPYTHSTFDPRAGREIFAGVASETLGGR